MSAAALQRLARLLPPERLLLRPKQLAAFESDGLTAFRPRPLVVAIPETSDAVIALVRLCHELKLPFVARGSGTSLSGGSLSGEDPAPTMLAATGLTLIASMLVSRYRLLPSSR